MSNILAGLKKDEAIEEEVATVGGGGAIDSGVYPVKITSAFIGYSKGKAMSLTIHAKKEDGFEIRNTQWITSGEAKGCKNYYEKDGKKHYLPGFNTANAICQLTMGKDLSEMDIDEKVINLYDFEAQKELPKSVPMLVDLIGQDIALGLIKEVVDKNALNDQTGQYEPTGETREQNEIDRVFHAESGLILQEVKAGDEEPVFLGKWKEKWEGKVRNKAKGAKGGKTAGAATGGAKPSKSLFGKTK